MPPQTPERSFVFGRAWRHSFDREQWSTTLLSLTDLGLAAVLLFSPLFMGGRHPVGRFVLITCICFTGIVWMLRLAIQDKGQWRWSGAEWLLVALLALVFVQLMPLTPELLGIASPNVSKLLPLWTVQTDSPASLGTWSQITLAPQATRQGLALLAGYAMLFLVVVQRLQTIDDVERLLRTVAAAATFIGTIGLLQFLFGNGKFLWLYDLRKSKPLRPLLGDWRWPADLVDCECRLWLEERAPTLFGTFRCGEVGSVYSAGSSRCGWRGRFSGPVELLARRSHRARRRDWHGAGYLLENGHC
jgi:hypothetical protein